MMWTQAVHHCRCGHPKLNHDIRGGGECEKCCPCVLFDLDEHRYPLGFVVTS